MISPTGDCFAKFLNADAAQDALIDGVLRIEDVEVTLPVEGDAGVGVLHEDMVLHGRRVVGRTGRVDEVPRDAGIALDAVERR